MSRAVGTGGPPALYELRVGVFATPEGVRDFVHRARALLAGPAGAAARRWTVSVAQEADPASPSGGDDASLTVAGLYDELPQQWAIEHPGRDPRGRTTAQVRFGVVTEAPDAVHEALCGLLCPEPLHPGPCPVPWAADSRACDDEHERAYLEGAYRHLLDGRSA
ncbi:hypothetical protein [Streptomonospora arabica]|uniref:Uncharacterized protein n=1 Tax=Streptomonospora arabica TaxID=412417 RepID=A0ABV9SR60_9ACTN